jgi:beta-lactam-binding protein with PASTA domain
MVINTDPVANTQVPKGSSVTVNVSLKKNARR